jgi:N-acetylglutamate synthase-like GNAT family acetyltransferase
MFREARPGDFPGVIRLYRQLHPHDPVLTDGSDEAVFNRILETTGLNLFVLEKDGAIVASTYLNIVLNMTRSASPYAIIENVVVDEVWRSTGIGKQVMVETIQAAWNADCYKVTLTTGSQNPNTHAFYRACGFSAETKTAYHVNNPAAQKP